MRKFYLLALMAMVAISCHREVEVIDPMPSPSEDVTAEITPLNVRTYDEALAIAEDALKMVDGDDTRSANKRRIMRNSGQVVSLPVTRGGEDVGEQPIMYVFNNENNEGFTIVAAEKSRQPLIAVTESGNYTYGEPTDVDAFDAYIDGVVERMVVTPGTPITPIPPIPPTPAYITDTVRYDYTSVGPLLSTKWGQSGIYAREIPLGRAGCVPIAIAQVMAYHRYPYTLELTYKTPSTTISLNWTNILKHVSGNGYLSGLYCCDCGCDYDALSKMIKEIGVRAGIDYSLPPIGGDVSVSAGIEDAIRVLHQMGYSATEFVPIFDIQTYMSDLLSDLQDGRPALLAGHDSSVDEGHMWVADGYKYMDYEIDFYRENPNYNPIIFNGEPQYVYEYTITAHNEWVHLNWGWNGMCNGWFDLDYYATDNADVYDDPNVNNNHDYNFRYNIELIYEIYPEFNIVNPNNNQ